MSEFLEGNSNVLFHILYEFHIFLYTLNYTSKSAEFHNIILDAQRIHARAVLDFFRDQKKYKDDIIITDILDKSVNPDEYIFADSDEIEAIRKIINKTTAHLTYESCKEDIYHDNDDLHIRLFVKLVNLIKHFVFHLPDILNDENKAYLNDTKTQELHASIKSEILITMIKNGNNF